MMISFVLISCIAQKGAAEKDLDSLVHHIWTNPSALPWTYAVICRAQ